MTKARSNAVANAAKGDLTLFFIPLPYLVAYVGNLLACVMIEISVKSGLLGPVEEWDIFRCISFLVR